MTAAAALSRASYSSRCIARQQRPSGLTCSLLIESRSLSNDTKSTDEQLGRRTRRPRLQLSRDLAQRLWDALREDSTDSILRERISFDQEKSPVELFEESSSTVRQGRITIDPDKVMLDLFASKEGRIRRARDDLRKNDDDEEVLDKSDSVVHSHATDLERDIERFLECAKQSAAPKRHIEQAQSVWEEWHQQSLKDSSLPSLKLYKNILYAYASIARSEVYNKNHGANKALSLLALLDEGVLKASSRANPSDDGVSSCEQCGALFKCGAENQQKSCWCFEYPAVLPVDKTKACMCPSCLEKTIDTKQEQSAVVLEKHISADASCYGAVIQAFASAERGIESTRLEVTPATLAESVLERMEALHAVGKLEYAPNSHCYGNVIRAWSLWATQTACMDSVASRADCIVQRLCDHIVRGEEISVDSADVSRWLNQVIKIVSQTKLGGSPEKADELLERIEHLYLSTDWSTRRTIVQPDHACYCSVLSAYGDSTHIASRMRAVRSLNVMNRMIQTHKRKPEWRRSACRPSTSALHIVLRTCASVSTDESELLSRVRTLFDEFLSSRNTSLNSLSFGLMIEAYEKLSSVTEERFNGIREIFETCCHHGKINNFVLERIRRACSSEELSTLLGPEVARHLGDGSFHSSMVPASWTGIQIKDCSALDPNNRLAASTTSL